MTQRRRQPRSEFRRDALIAPLDTGNGALVGVSDAREIDLADVRRLPRLFERVHGDAIPSMHNTSAALYVSSALLDWPMVGSVGPVEYSEFLRCLGAVVRQLRNASERSQTQIGLEVGVDQGSVSRLENGEQGFDSDTLFNYAKTFGIPVFELIRRGEQPNREAGLSDQALDIARRWESLTPPDRAKFEALLLIVAGPNLPSHLPNPLIWRR